MNLIKIYFTPLLLLLIAGCQTNEQLLFKAIYDKDSLQTERLIERGADVNAKDRHGRTPLYSAALSGQTDVMTLLIAKGADVNAGYDHGCTPLHAAALNGHVAATRLLVAKGADVDAKISSTNSGTTPLLVAVGGGHIELVKLLVARGADVKATAYGHTALHKAAGGGGLFWANQDMVQARLALVKFFLAKGIDVNAKTKNGWTPLYCAARSGCREVAELLITEGADVNAKANDGHIPLHATARCCNMQVAMVLLAHGADVNAKTKNGNTVLHTLTTAHNMSSGCFCGHTKTKALGMVGYLIAKGADIDARDNRSGCTPLHTAVLYGTWEMVYLLLDAGANPNVKDNQGKTPFDCAKERRARQAAGN